MTCSAVRSTRGCAAACPHSRVVLLIGSTPTQSLFFCAWSRCTREDKKDHLSSPTAFPFLPTTSRCASPASISQRGIVVAAVLDVHDDVAPSIQSTSVEGSIDRGLLHLQPDPLSIGESSSSSHGGRVAALCNSKHVFFYTRQKRGRILPRNCHLASDVSLTCKHSSCHTLPSTSTTFDSKFSNHGDASAAHKPTHIMAVRVAAFSPTKLHVAVPFGPLLDQCQFHPFTSAPRRVVLLQREFMCPSCSPLALALQYGSRTFSDVSPLFELVVPD